MSTNSLISVTGDNKCNRERTKTVYSGESVNCAQCLPLTSWNGERHPVAVPRIREQLALAR
jgi:hypothetical protein